MKIVAFDDAKLMRFYLGKHLSAVGFEVEAMNPDSLFEALGVLRELRPALLITDYEMPGCNGESLVRAIREDPELSQLPVLIHSSHGEEDLVGRLSQWGILGYLLKPASAEGLQWAVCQACRTHGLALPSAAEEVKPPSR